MYTNLLVPVALDHREAAETAIKVAQGLCAKNARITLLHVIERVPPYAEHYLTPEIIEKNVSEAATQLAELASASGDAIATEVVSGHAAQTILEHAEKAGSDCIVIASHKPGLEDYLIGSTAARVVRHATCAVHIIR